MTGNREGKLHVRRQLDDYTFRDLEFEDMGFLNYSVETYERRMPGGGSSRSEDNDDDNESNHRTDLIFRYLSIHPKSSTHVRICRAENHNFLPNVVGPWFPRRDGEESTKPFYHASMLALLKPWRDLRELKDENKSWEDEFNFFLETASQRDKDVISGSQYYYESKSVVADRFSEDVLETNFGNGEESVEDFDDEDNNEIEINNVTVSKKKIILLM